MFYQFVRKGTGPRKDLQIGDAGYYSIGGFDVNEKALKSAAFQGF